MKFMVTFPLAQQVTDEQAGPILKNLM